MEMVKCSTSKHIRLTPGSKGIVYNVLKYMLTLFPEDNRTSIKQRVSEATGVSLRTVERIIQQAKNYEKWIKEQLISNLPVGSVVVTDNALYHSVQINKAFTSNSKNMHIISWLREKNLPFVTSMLKPQLYEIIKQHKQDYIQYKFDKVLKECENVSLKLPPYRPDLNPIKIVWAHIKNEVAKQNVYFKLEDVKALVEQEFARVTVDNWKKVCEHIVKVEDKYLESECRIIVNIEELGIDLNDSSDDNSASNYESK
ncbi:uncharacterized protein [Diabrotica undecimpunctata]|uniref:uncharacterized protein n=1 Tax=Diabrotica undecimpunctata TaxID=50387 RepID=UPI003B63D31B